MPIQRKEIAARLDLARAAMASVIEASRDDRLTAKQYEFLIMELEATLKVLRRHAQTPWSWT